MVKTFDVKPSAYPRRLNGLRFARSKIQGVRRISSNVHLPPAQTQSTKRATRKIQILQIN